MSAMLDKSLIVKKGGTGSGHFGHAGRKGQRGGSVPGKAGGGFAPGQAGHIYVEDNARNYIIRDDKYGMIHDDGVRSAVKMQIINDIHARIPPEAGVTRGNVHDVLETWARTSNDTDVAALSLQQAASEEFGMALSTWQQDSWNYTKENNFTRYTTHQRTFPRDKERAILRAMYDNTQADLRAHGYEPGDSINLFRGVELREHGDMGNYIKLPTGVMNYNGNAIESWSASAGVAKTFTSTSARGSNVLSQRVPIENIIATARTGLGCLPEQEFVVFGTIPGTQVRVLDT